MQPMNISGSSEELFLILCVLLAMSYALVPPCMPLWSAHCYSRNGASSTSKELEYSYYKAPLVSRLHGYAGSDPLNNSD